MKLGIVGEDFEYHIPIPDQLAEPLAAQLSTFESDEIRERFSSAVLQQLKRFLEDHLNPDLRPPSDKQLAYAEDICRKKRIRLPREALLYRSHMNKFIDEHVKPRS